jgi:hypothetical protein
LLLILTACGSSAPSRGPVANPSPNNRSSDTANIAQQANEPRSSDPTAAGATNMSPTTGATATLTPSPSSGASAAEPGSPPAAGNARRAGAKSNADPPKKIGARHVLVQWMGAEHAPTSVVRSKEQALAVVQEVLKRAKAKEDFARLAVEFSDEPGSGNRGGSLGRFGRGQMVGAFEAAAFKLDVGEISEIVESPFGYHVIQRTE